MNNHITDRDIEQWEQKVRIQRIKSVDWTKVSAYGLSFILNLIEVYKMGDESPIKLSAAEAKDLVATGEEYLYIPEKPNPVEAFAILRERFGDAFDAMTIEER